jgi:hypothetical protein
LNIKFEAGAAETEDVSHRGSGSTTLDISTIELTYTFRILVPYVICLLQYILGQTHQNVLSFSSIPDAIYVSGFCLRRCTANMKRKRKVGDHIQQLIRF